MRCSESNKSFRFLFLDLCIKTVYQSFKKDFEIIISLNNVNKNCVFSNSTTSKFESLYVGPLLIHEGEHARVFARCKCKHLKEI